MQHSSHHTDPIARIEQRLVDIQLTLQSQTAAIARLHDELTNATRHNDWYHIQFSEMIRTIARDLRDLRATMIYSVINDGPISAAVVKALIEQSREEQRTHEIGVAGPPRGN